MLNKEQSVQVSKLRDETASLEPQSLIAAV